MPLEGIEELKTDNQTLRNSYHRALSGGKKLSKTVKSLEKGRRFRNILISMLVILLVLSNLFMFYRVFQLGMTLSEMSIAEAIEAISEMDAQPTKSSENLFSQEILDNIQGIFLEDCVEVIGEESRDTCEELVIPVVTCYLEAANQGRTSEEIPIDCGLEKTALGIQVKYISNNN